MRKGVGSRLACHPKDSAKWEGRYTLSNFGKIWDLFMGKTKRGRQTYDQNEVNESCNNINNYCDLSVGSLFFISMARALKRYFFPCFPCSLKVPRLGEQLVGLPVTCTLPLWSLCYRKFGDLLR